MGFSNRISFSEYPNDRKYGMMIFCFASSSE